MKLPPWLLFFALLPSACRAPEAPAEPASDFGFDAAGLIHQHVRDHLGRAWRYEGRLLDLRPVYDAVVQPRPDAGGKILSVESPDESTTPVRDSGDTGEPTRLDGDPASYVFVPLGPPANWLVYGLVDDDPSAIAAAVGAYDAAHPEPMEPPTADVASKNGEASNDSRHGVIKGTEDDRVTVNMSLAIPGGSDSDKYTAFRRLMPNGCSTSIVEVNSATTIGVTAAHCFTDGSGATDTDSTLRVCEADGTSCVSINRIAVHGLYRGSQVYKFDWAVWKAPAAISLGGGSPFTLDSTNNEADGQTINNLGFPGWSNTVKLHGGCKIKDTFSQRLAYDCDTEGGHSGGPTYKFFSSSGTRQIVAIHGGAQTFWNTGARVSHWRSDIISAISAVKNHNGTSEAP